MANETTGNSGVVEVLVEVVAAFTTTVPDIHEW
jgi:hypothetical protein